jgi:V/A-type H+-transporting ATPase subunit A
MKHGTIVKVSGPLVVAEGIPHAHMYDVVYVSEERLIGEIIELRGREASIQVYEDTSGLGPGAPVSSTGEPLAVHLGPGLLTSIYDGIQRPLDAVRRVTGDMISRGATAPPLDPDKVWEFEPVAAEGDLVGPGDVLGTVRETTLVTTSIMVPPGLTGKVTGIRGGRMTVNEAVAEVSDGRAVHPVTMVQRWPVRQPRPCTRKLPPVVPLMTGQRIIDALFPLAKGGTASIPGPFGSGKTVVQHQLAKWADAKVIVYIGCGERGNEMTDVLQEFPELIDPASGQPLILRTVLIANTSNMPVAAREASIYTGITIAEFYRDMGYDVALMADSTSRWAEALREISGRLQEMPGEEGYPAYLATRLAEFYERAGRVVTLGSAAKEGTLTVVGAVSPPGGDLSDPVVQGTLKVVKVFWGLDDKLAHRRHFPAINWLTSYSLYADNLRSYYAAAVGLEWDGLRGWAMGLLQREAEVEEIARLIGKDALSAQDQLLLETARSIREDFLHQNAFMANDQFTTLQRQKQILGLIRTFHLRAGEALAEGTDTADIFTHPMRMVISRLKARDQFDESDAAALEREIEALFRNPAETAAEVAR